MRVMVNMKSNSNENNSELRTRSQGNDLGEKYAKNSDLLKFGNRITSQRILEMISDENFRALNGRSTLKTASNEDVR